MLSDPVFSVINVVIYKYYRSYILHSIIITLIVVAIFYSSGIVVTVLVPICIIYLLLWFVGVLLRKGPLRRVGMEYKYGYKKYLESLKTKQPWE
jgi:hypothetical protein